MDKELLDFNNAQIALSEAKAYLAATDYVVIKIAEATALNEDITSLLEEYEEVLLKRKHIRESIPKLEEALESASDALFDKTNNEPVVDQNEPEVVGVPADL